MKKNRRMPRKMSVIAERAMYVGVVIVMLFVMVIINLLASSSCTQLMKSIGGKEATLAKLEESRLREANRWDEMTSPDRLNRHLHARGLAMYYPKPAQNVRMRADGRPYPGQFSLVQAEARANRRNSARAAVAPRPATAAASARRTRRR